MKNLVLYGPPGTGKTRRLLNMVGEHLAEHPGRVLFCSHTRAAAQEALSRWPQENMERIDIQTLHSVCFRALKMSKAQTVDDSKLRTFGEEFGIDMEPEGLGKEFIDVLALGRARCINTMDAYEQSWKPGTPSHFDAFVTSYNNWKDEFGYLDFNDMLSVGTKTLTAKDINYSLIAIDEAQDLSTLHWMTIYRFMELCPKARVIVAGDDDQTLYTFAGADPHGMTIFGERARADAQVLSQSYRITQQVYDLAQAIIARVSRRVAKSYEPRTGLDGKPAQGKVEIWPHMDHLKVDPNRDSLLLYADRFVRGEVEPILQENAWRYTALNGWQAPLDTKAGEALIAIAQWDNRTILEDDALRNVIRAGLSRHANEIWDRISPAEVLQRIRRGDYSVLSMRISHVDYFREVQLNGPVMLRITTMHGAKGLQADDVHLILSLSPRAWAEAEVDADHLHRLLYTAVTRAKDNLYIYDGDNGYELPEEYR